MRFFFKFPAVLLTKEPYRRLNIDEPTGATPNLDDDPAEVPYSVMEIPLLF